MWNWDERMVTDGGVRGGQAGAQCLSSKSINMALASNIAASLYLRSCISRMT